MLGIRLRRGERLIRWHWLVWGSGFIRLAVRMMRSCYLSVFRRGRGLLLGCLVLVLFLGFVYRRGRERIFCWFVVGMILDAGLFGQGRMLRRLCGLLRRG